MFHHANRRRFLKAIAASNLCFWLGLAFGWVALPGAASAMLYKSSSGMIKDNCVVWHNGTYYLLTMYWRRALRKPTVCGWRPLPTVCIGRT